MRMDYYKKYQEIIAGYNREKDRVTVEETLRQFPYLQIWLDPYRLLICAAIMESMKMETALYAPQAGRIAEIRCQPGQVVEMGAVIMVIDS